jgi:hypothetical protein
MFAIKMGALLQSDEELTGVSIFSTVGHRQETSMSVTSNEVFILESAGRIN